MGRMEESNGGGCFVGENFGEIKFSEVGRC